MLQTIFRKVVGSRNERVLRRMQKTVEQINALANDFEQLSDDALKAKTAEYRQRLASGGESLRDLLPEAFATVREVSQRTLGMRHFDVQLIGGMVLNEGNIAEMRTGEGKTLVATLPAYLNALSGKGVHIVTVNDYLAKRDAEWMKPVYEFFGLNVGVILSQMEPAARQQAYAADITYGTNNEFGFDYLRDNMVFSLDDKVQRQLNFAIVDEVDSILIDEARTPLIISGASDDSSELYHAINKVIPKLELQTSEDGPGDYSLDEKAKQAYLTEQGHQTIESLLSEAGLLKAGENLYSPQHIALMHHMGAALRAHKLYQRDVDYIVQNNEVVIVDEHTGRTMPGRRWSDGLHQAVEAKEGVVIQSENQTLASITFQNYFRLYNKLSGMTGTADTEAYEFQQIYGLEVLVMPTNKPMVRDDRTDLVYLTKEEKFAAVIDDIKECRARLQPVLVGTASIETSEYLSKLLQKANIKHQVLNAKFHEKEAHIVAEAGRPGAVTIATNMAGRGTDIVLGGNLESELTNLSKDSTNAQRDAVREDWQARHRQVLESGGLHIIGSERHESRRIDNQLRGRAGRQGDAGSSRFYLSLQDDLMRIFASDRVAGIMQKLGLRDGEAIEHPWVNKAIENAQRKVEGRNFDIRKQLLEYDDVANDQRRVIYAQRAELMATDDVTDAVNKMRQTVAHSIIAQHIPPQSLEEQWDVEGLEHQLASEFGIKLSVQKWLKQDDNLHEESLYERIQEAFKGVFIEKEALIGKEMMQQFEKSILLQSLDHHWKEHLAAMDHLRQGIHLRGYAQKDPRQEYKREAFSLFSGLLDNVKQHVVSIICSVQIAEEDVEAVEQQRRAATHSARQYQHTTNQEPQTMQDTNDDVAPFVRQQPKVGRNDLCPCGSGKKFKHCHGKIT